jgi:hypothetical protein
MVRSLFKRPLILVGSCVLLLFLLQFLTACAQSASVQVASAQTTQQPFTLDEDKREILNNLIKSLEKDVNPKIKTSLYSEYISSFA